MEDIKVNNIPSTIICSRAVSDITSFLEDIMREQNLNADVMCMVLRDVSSHFERMRADDYSMSIIKHMAQIEVLRKENEDLKKMAELFNMEDKTHDNSENEC